jgi:hypothetical protein
LGLETIFQVKKKPARRAFNKIVANWPQNIA